MGTQFRFTDLCRDNGQRKLGETPSDFKEKNCKKSLEVKFELWMRNNDLPDFGKIYGPKYGHIEACRHDYECVLFAKIPGPPSTTETPPQGNIIFIENVGLLGSVAGQNNENVLNSNTAVKRPEKRNEDNLRTFEENIEEADELKEKLLTLQSRVSIQNDVDNTSGRNAQFNNMLFVFGFLVIGIVNAVVLYYVL